MTQDQPSRLDLMQAEIEADRQANREKFEQIQQWYDNERQLVAELRTRQEVQSNQLATISNQISETRSAVEALLQIAQIHQQGLERLTNEFRQHRSDAHGA
ncbi:hypothetical protein IQ250_06845 [Pseudanabaenaceae cyanobacterium LEGE 13415]|nr:hypothetical protein [Pseudanabaenaceae cyanobacterium LEGE 13415]